MRRWPPRSNSTPGNPRPALPPLWLYHARDRCAPVVPDECQCRLARLPARLFDTCLARTRELDDYLRRVEVMVELRGVVTRLEALLPLREMLGTRDARFHIGGLLGRLEEDEPNFRDVGLPGFGDGAYVHVDLLDKPGALPHGGGLREPRGLGAIVGSALSFQPRDAAEFSDLDALERWMRGHASCQALVTYPDGRVPEGADDRGRAVDYADGIVSAARAIHGAEGV